MPTDNPSSRDTPLGGGFLISQADHKEAEDNFFQITKKLSKKRHKTLKNTLKRSRRYHPATHSGKASIFEEIGIDNALPVEERRVYNLIGDVGEKEAHFEEVKSDG